MEEYPATINVRRKNNFLIDSAEDLHGECLPTFPQPSEVGVLTGSFLRPLQ